MIQSEIQIHNGLKHKNIVKMIDYGTDGVIIKPSGRKIDNLVYIMLEYVTGGDFYETVQNLNGMGEKGGRFFMNQLVDFLAYMNKKNVTHRDLKLENILIDEYL